MYLNFLPIELSSGLTAWTCLIGEIWKEKNIFLQIIFKNISYFFLQNILTIWISQSWAEAFLSCMSDVNEAGGAIILVDLCPKIIEKKNWIIKHKIE